MLALEGVRCTLLLMGYTEEEIRRLSELGRDPNNWEPADPEAWEQGRRMAMAIADTYTDKDWAIVLNALAPSRAAQQISFRPPEDRRRLLGLVDPDRRADVEAFLAVTT